MNISDRPLAKKCWAAHWHCTAWKQILCLWALIPSTQVSASD